MQRIVFLIAVVILGLTMFGCAGTGHKHNATEQTVTGIIFTEAPGSAIPSGMGVVHVTASIKTHPAGFHPLESSDSHHGADHYPFAVRIGEQSATWNIKGEKADTPKYAPDGSNPKDPEAGPGMRYSLDKRLLLKPGVYDVRIELPDDSVTAYAKVIVAEGQAVSVTFKPIYKTKRLPVPSPSYTQGISKLEGFVNGQKQ